jgi:sarcosine oxidase subunit beta
MEMRSADVVIVGGGVNGAATAFYLAQLNVGKIIVLDRAYPGAGASSRGMGLLRTYHANDPEAVLAIKSLEVFRNWKDAVGGTCGFVETGFLYLERSARRDAVATNVGRVNRLGGRAELIDGAALGELQPHMNVEDTVAAWEPDCGYAYGALAVDAFLDGARRMGASLMTRMPALALRTVAGRIAGIETASGPISTGTVVLAAGAWSAPLAATAGVTLRIEPRRLTIGRVYLPDGIESPATFLDAAVDTSFKPDGARTALISMRDDRYGCSIDPDGLADDVDVSAVGRGIERLAKRIPLAKLAAGGRTWTGVDGFTPDFKGIYGNVDGVEGLIVCAGASEKGFKVSPAVGMGLAQLVAHGKCDFIEDSAFAANRFRAGRTDNKKNAISVSELI